MVNEIYFFFFLAFCLCFVPLEFDNLIIDIPAFMSSSEIARLKKKKWTLISPFLFIIFSLLSLYYCIDNIIIILVDERSFRWAVCGRWLIRGVRALRQEKDPFRFAMLPEARSPPLVPPSSPCLVSMSQIRNGFPPLCKAGTSPITIESSEQKKII